MAKKIGIGITSYKRPQMLDKTLEHIEKFTEMDEVKLYIAFDTDENRKGIAYRKNECLRALSDCDYIFLLDDDCYPIKDGWINFFIENSGERHLLYMIPRLHGNPHRFGKFSQYGNCGGVFMFLTKKHILETGAFNEDFGWYGYEHCDYSERIYGGRGQYLMLTDTPKYIHAEDYVGKTQSSMEIFEKQKAIKKAAELYYSNNRKKYISL